MKAISIRITAIIIGALGLAMAVSGAELLSIGGSPYYAIAGALMLVCAVDLFNSKSIETWRRKPTLKGT